MSHYYQTCSRCGANLDPGEKCDCRDERREESIKAIYYRPKDKRKRPAVAV